MKKKTYTTQEIENILRHVPEDNGGITAEDVAHAVMGEIESIDEVTWRLCDDDVIPFQLVGASSVNGSDAYLRCEYWSNKLKCNVIYKYDVGTHFDDLADFAGYLAYLANEITDFERRITLRK